MSERKLVPSSVSGAESPAKSQKVGKRSRSHAMSGTPQTKVSGLMIVKSRQQAAGRKRDQGHEATGHELSSHPPAVAK